MQEFHGFFHDCQVSAKIRIKDIVGAQLLEGCNHLAFDESARVHTKGFAETDADSRCGLNHDDLAWIGNGGFYFVYVRDFRNGAKGTHGGALATVDANRHVVRARQIIVIHDGLRSSAGTTAQCAILALSFVELNRKIMFINGYTALYFFKSGLKFGHFFSFFYANTITSY